MNWYWWVILINWPGCYILCNLYCIWLHRISHDVEFEGWIWWRGFFPISRYRLISKKSWFARAWDKFYGHGLFGCIIHRDEKGSFDDQFVEGTIVHEIRHVIQNLMCGAIFYIIYAIDYLLHGYKDVWFEKDARNAVIDWMAAGKPKVFNFGKRY